MTTLNLLGVNPDPAGRRLLPGTSKHPFYQAESRWSCT